MLDETKKYHRPQRLKGYDYSSPGYYFVTFNTKVRRENILCSISGHVGPAPLGGSSPPIITLTQAGKILCGLIENVDQAYCNAQIDCYAIMPDHVHLLIYLRPVRNDPPRGAGPTGRKSSLPQIINTLKSLTSKRIGYPLWQEGYHDHIIRNDADLYAARQYIQNNPTQWELDRT